MNNKQIPTETILKKKTRNKKNGNRVLPGYYDYPNPFIPNESPNPWTPAPWKPAPTPYDPFTIDTRPNFPSDGSIPKK